MLSKDEEEVVDHLILLLKLPSHSDKLVPERVLWLAEKLKETNDELAQVHAELQKTNEDFTKFVERYEG